MYALSVPRYQLWPALPPWASHPTSLTLGFLIHNIRVTNASLTLTPGTEDTGPMQPHCCQHRAELRTFLKIRFIGFSFRATEVP